MRAFIKSSDNVKLILILSTIFFSMGYIADGINFFIAKNWLYLWCNVVSIVLIWIVLLLFKQGALKLNNALLAHVAIVSLNIYCGITFEILKGPDASILHVVECMCICMVPAILSGMVNRWVPFVVTSCAIVLYVIVGISSGNKDEMLAVTPAFSIVIIGLGFTFSFLLDVTRRIERKNAQAMAEQKNIMQVFDFTPKQWELIKEGRMSRERLNKLLDRNNKDAKEKMLHEVKNMIQSDESIKNAIRVHHPNLTFREMELACMIAKEMTVTKIARLRNIKEHSVTAQRSRLRTKLGLTDEQNLNEYLTSVVRNDV